MSEETQEEQKKYPSSYEYAAIDRVDEHNEFLAILQHNQIYLIDQKYSKVLYTV